jgi:NTP pyrophosphatase (non-canonical NTP hydrolase)
MSHFEKYKNFVGEVTSQASKDHVAFTQRLNGLHTQGCPIERLLTASVGMSAEAGEFMEIVKKIIFQGKPWEESNIEHLKIELGDIMWYVAQACISLDITMEDLLDMNIKKLSKRYPEGTFDAYYSENRAADDR